MTGFDNTRICNVFHGYRQFWHLSENQPKITKMKCKGLKANRLSYVVYIQSFLLHNTGKKMGFLTVDNVAERWVVDDITGSNPTYRIHDISQCVSGRG